LFEFVVLSTLRAAQLMRGCSPRVAGVHKATVIARAEVAGGFVTPWVHDEAGAAPASPTLPPAAGTL
jgi:DNA-directed RNA polymerase subunit K/omega